MFRVKEASILLSRLALASAAMYIAYILGTMVIGQTGANERGTLALSPAEASQAGKALLLVSLVSALVLSFLILRSRWHGLKLIGATFLVQTCLLWWRDHISLKSRPRCCSLVASPAGRCTGAKNSGRLQP
jgi:hypothetical protein